jgi:hypothetical protein
VEWSPAGIAGDVEHPLPPLLELFETKGVVVGGRQVIRSKATVRRRCVEWNEDKQKSKKNGATSGSSV